MVTNKGVSKEDYLRVQGWVLQHLLAFQSAATLFMAWAAGFSIWRLG